jgi:hypothetical protein
MTSSPDLADSAPRRIPGLRSNHLEDLRRSGLTDSTVESWGCFSINPQNTALLKPFAKDVTVPGLALPILPPGSLKTVGFAYKPDDPRKLVKNGRIRTCKYELPRRGINRIHVPRAAQYLFRPPDGREGPMRLVITEGQKKAEKAAQEGIGCIAVFGVWSWLDNFGGLSVPIGQLADIDWPRYLVELCFDSDAVTNPNVRRAEQALARWLRSRGAAKVSIVRLPAGEAESRVGLDDYLVIHSVQEFEALPRLDNDQLPLEDAVEMLTLETEKKERNATLARIIAEETDLAEQERLLKKAAKRTGISLRSISNSAKVEATRLRTEKRKDEPSQRLTPEEVEKAREKRKAAVEAILDEAQRAVTLRAQTWTREQLVYVCAFGGTRAVLLNSDGEAVSAAGLPEGVTITQPPPDRSPISPDGVRRFTAGENVVARTLFGDLSNFFARHAIFKHPSVAPALALWTMGSYLYNLLNYYGYLWFTSLGPSHGKSLVEKILSILCFNATPSITVPTAATLFRDTEANAGTLILDEIENLDPEKKGDVLAILNAGFERGDIVPRSVPAGDGWVTRSFSVYCPKAIAGISYLPRTLHTRVFQIEMPKKKPNEKVDNFEPDRLASLAERMRDDQAIFALRNANKIAEMYVGRSELVLRGGDSEGRPLLDDRLRDILAPLYALAAVVDHEAGSLVATPALDAFAAVQAGWRNSDPASDDYAIAAHALFDWASPRWQGGKVVIKTAAATELFKSVEIDWVTEPARAKSLLRKLGGQNRSVWWMEQTIRGYVFIQSELQDLVDRHPIPTEVHLCVEEKR